MRRVFAASLLALALSSDASAAVRVVIALVDGLDADAVGPALTPAIHALATEGKERAVFYPRARAVMPTVTNTNHVSVMTGVYPAAHGITGNQSYDRDTKKRTAFDRGEQIEVETLFTRVARARSGSTAGLFGKWKLAELFRGGGSQRPPNVLWGDIEGDRSLGEPGSDERTMDEAIRALVGEPRLLFVALGDVDRISHFFGPDSHSARGALLEADAQIARLVRALKGQGIWSETVLFITSDHGFASVEPTEERRHPMITFGRELERAELLGSVFPIANGSVESLYAAAGADLEKVRELAKREPGIADVFTPETLPAEWRLHHPRIGELFLVARPGYFFNDPYNPATAAVRGMHGGADTREIPIVITGGYPKLSPKRIDADGAAANPDVGATAAWLLELGEPKSTGGKTVPAEFRGRVLEEAFGRADAGP